jgi:hypothetical protein
MLRILNDGTAQNDWPKEKHLEFVKKCEVYIKDLQARGQLVAAQPLARQGVVLSGSGKQWTEQPLDVRAEVQVGYYLIRAESVAAAVDIAKGNPEFEYSDSARVEIRPLKAEEAISGYAYPTLKPA